VEIRVSRQPAEEYDGDALVVGIGERAAPEGPLAALDERLGGLISGLIEAGEVRGKPDELTLVHTQGRLPARRLAIVGLGPPADLDLYALRRASGAAARRLRDRGCRRLGTTLHLALEGRSRLSGAARAVVEAAYVGLYRGGERQSERDLPEELEELALLATPPEQLEPASAAAHLARLGGEATNYCRRLVNLPANEVTPSRLAQEALDLAGLVGLEVEVLEPARLQELGMGAFLAVARGSQEPARLIVLRHRGRGDGRWLALVGKGLTFDSGGISIKPSENMHLMKGDMAGGAAVLAAMRAVAALGLKLDVLGIIPAAENLPGGGACRPGDVVVAYSGRTIEIINTDAEGRLLLADCLAYARDLGATHLVDIATLTGACVIALGHVAAGVMGTDHDLVEALLEAGEQAGERMWRLPLFPEYRSQLDSLIADLKNVGGRPAGAITGGWFLREFVGETSWAHLDIAGTAWSEKDQPHQVEGATGAGVRTLIGLAERLAGGVT